MTHLASADLSALLLIGLILLGVYCLCVLGLLFAGRGESARALAGFVPDLVVFFSRLARDPCVPRRRALLVGALVAYLASPIDLIPDFLPVIGQLDDAILAGVVLRLVIRDCPPSTLAELWPGPDSSLGVVLRLAGAARDDD